MNEQVRTPLQSQRGMSVVEVLVAVAIFSVIFIAALMVYDRSNRTFKEGVEASETQQNTRVAFEKIVSELRMTGFDYDRDGIPTGGSGGVNEQQQPDEQIEFIGQSAIVIRANFDYETDAANENGREGGNVATGAPNYQSPQFPVVTTGNDEIVAYVLRSTNASKNTHSVTYYADVSIPRRVYIGGTGQPERLVTIPEVDLTNENPPYTLYRVTLSETDDATPVFTPLANNIRSMRFDYYEDSTGLRALRDTSNVTIPPANLATVVGGLGQYNPANPAASIIPRAIRGKVQSIRLTLIGMNEAPDGAYTNRIEPLTGTVMTHNGTVADIRQFRQYRLESLIVPRNYSKRGMREQEMREPGAPTITAVCTGWCGHAYLTWQAPQVTPATGAVESYSVHFGTNATTLNNIIDVGLTTGAYVSGLLEPGQLYWFRVSAVNSYGSTPSEIVGPYSVKNRTTPDAPSVSATGDGTLPAEPNRIGLQWQRPITAAGSVTCSSGVPPTGSDGMPAGEVLGYRIGRTDMATGTSTVILTESQAEAERHPSTELVTWADTGVANCRQYQYTVQLFEGQPINQIAVPCGSGATYNDGAVGFSNPSLIAQGEAVSNVQPAAPESLTIAADSECTGGNCTINLAWSAVGSDVDGSPIRTGTYYLYEYRRLESELNPPTPTTDSPIELTIADPSAMMVNYQRVVPQYSDVPDVNGEYPPYRYEYEVTARQCSSPESDPSPRRAFPCNMGSVSIATSISVTVEGAGTAVNPWVTSAPANVDIAVLGGTVDQIRAVLFTPGGAMEVGTSTGTISGTTFGWPSGLSDGVIYRLEVTYEKGGCAITREYYVTEIANNCCLDPQFDRSWNVVNGTVVFVDGPSKLVRIRFVNRCEGPLVINTNGIEIRWDDAQMSNAGGKKVDRVVYPKVGGGTTAHSISDNQDGFFTTSPSFALQAVSSIPAGEGTSYTIDVYFTSSFAASPITQVCVKYQSDVGVSDSCQIVPFPSENDNACDATIAARPTDNP
jgi:prepilin-type N-terminal cleavage/methylation domain-containing protein